LLFSAVTSCASEADVRLNDRSGRAVGRVTDFWTGESLVSQDGRITVTLPPRTARLLKATA
jgi:hypothetical protein